MAWQRKVKPYCFPKASISGTITAFGPEPRSRARLVLSMTQIGAVYPQKISASWKKHFMRKRSNLR